MSLTAAEPTESGSGKVGLRVAIVFAGILLGTTMSGLDSSIVATAAPTIIADLGQLSLLPWLTTAYLLAQVSTMPLLGKLGDLFGRRLLFGGAIITFLVGSMLCGLSTSMGMLIVCRVVQGVGAGGITGLGMALVADIVPADRLGRYLGYTGLVFAATSVLGPFAGGLFVDHLSWRWAFYINVPSGIICLVTLAFVSVDQVRVRHRIDWLGATLLAGSLACLLLGLSHSDGQGWGSPRTVSLLVASGVLVVLFVAWERRAREPLLPMRILANRGTAIATFANLVAGFGFVSGVIYPPVFFQAVAGVDATVSGLLLAPFACSSAASTLAAGQITDRVGGFKVIPVIGMVLLTVGYFLLGSISASTAAWEVAVTAMIAGLGVGFVMQTLLYVVQRLSEPRDLGVATSTVMLSRVVGGAIGVAVLGTVFTTRLASEVARRLPGFPTSDIQGDPRQVAALAVGVRTQVVDSFAVALSSAFQVAVPVMIVGLVVTALLPARLIRERVAAAEALQPRADTAAHGL